MVSSHHIVLTGMVAVVAATGGWLLLSAEPPPAAAGPPAAAKARLALASDAQLRELQAQADVACMEEATTELCFERPVQYDYTDRCIFRERMYGACSAEEAEQRFQQAEARREAVSGCG